MGYYPGCIGLLTRARDPGRGQCQAGIMLLGIAMLVWLAVLRTVPVSLAYPMLSVNFVFVALAARVIWREPLTLRQFVGTLMIMVGVALMGSHL